MKDRIDLIGILLCVVSFVTIGAIGVYGRQQEEKQQVAVQQERVERIEVLLEAQRELLGSIMKDYRSNAYSSDVDRIAEQQLIATEYQLILLQLIAQQNVMMIKLLAEG